MTLVEVLVSLLLLGLVLGAGTTVVVVHLRTTAATTRKMEALHTARSVMEQLNGRPFQHADLNFGTHPLPNGGRYVVQPYPPGSPAPGLKRVTVSIPWPGGSPGSSAQAPEETLVTIISEVLNP